MFFDTRGFNAIFPNNFTNSEVVLIFGTTKQYFYTVV